MIFNSLSLWKIRKLIINTYRCRLFDLCLYVVFYYFYLLIFIDWKLKLKTLWKIFLLFLFQRKSLEQELNQGSFLILPLTLLLGYAIYNYQTVSKSRLISDTVTDVNAQICYIWISNCKDSIGGVMINMLASSAVDRQSMVELNQKLWNLHVLLLH